MPAPVKPRSTPFIRVRNWLQEVEREAGERAVLRIKGRREYLVRRYRLDREVVNELLLKEYTLVGKEVIFNPTAEHPVLGDTTEPHSPSNGAVAKTIRKRLELEARLGYRPEQAPEVVGPGGVVERVNPEEDADRRDGDRRAAFERLWEEAPARSDARAAAVWVSESIGVDIGSLTPPPNRQAVVLLRSVESDPKVKDTFWSKTFPALMPTKGETNEAARRDAAEARSEEDLDALLSIAESEARGQLDDEGDEQ